MRFWLPIIGLGCLWLGGCAPTGPETKVTPPPAITTQSSTAPKYGEVRPSGGGGAAPPMVGGAGSPGAPPMAGSGGPPPVGR